MSEAQAESASGGSQSTVQGWLDQAIDLTEQGLGKERATSVVGALVDQIGHDAIKWKKNVSKSIQAGIAEIDEALSKQLSAIMHAEAFQKLEGSWRGMRYLVFNSETCRSLKIKVINLPKRELYKDLDSAVEFDQSRMFKMIYEHEFGTPGGEPYGALVGDYEFTTHPEDMDIIEKMSQIAASAMAPFVTATAAGMFGFKSFTQLSEPRDLERIFETVEYTRWRSFRESPDSRYVVMTMPHVLARLPYGFNTRKIDEFDFEEVEQGADGSTAKKTAHEKYCWMNSAYVYAVRLTSAFSKTNWCTQVVGKENGGTIEGLPVHIFESDAGDKKIKCPTEVAITDRRDAELGKLGFMPLCWYKNTDYAVFFGTQTVHKAKKYVAAADNANSELSAMLPYIMASSRLGHFLKMIARDKQGSFMEASDCEKWLQDWVSQYVLADNNPSPQMKASYPLRECKVMVTADPKRPGVYGAQILLRPWLMMRELNAALSMVADLPKT